MIIDQNVIVIYNPRVKKHYELKGYKIPKNGDKFEINIKDLSIGSGILIKIKCDFCNEIFENKYCRVNKQNVHSCSKCVFKKIEQTNLILYGNKCPMQNEKIQEKIIKGNIEKHGVDFLLKSPKIHKKSKETCMKKYGVNNYAKTEESKLNYKEICIERYGVDNAAKSNEIKEKTINTNLKKYGFTHPMKNKKYARKVNIKRLKTLYKNGNGICSCQQRYLHNLLGGELNYPVSLCMLDIT